MRFYQDEVDLCARFKERVEALCPGLPIDWPTVKTEKATDGDYKDMMVRFRVSTLADSRLIATQGDIKHYRNYGSVLMQVLGPMGEGPGRLKKTADLLSTIFVGWRHGGMLGRTPSASSVVEEKSTASLTVSVPYTSDFKADKQGNVLP